VAWRRPPERFVSALAGMGRGLPAKSSWLDASNPDYRQILEQFGFYNRALASNLPFPKTRASFS